MVLLIVNNQMHWIGNWYGQEIKHLLRSSWFVRLRGMCCAKDEEIQRRGCRWNNAGWFSKLWDILLCDYKENFLNHRLNFWGSSCVCGWLCVYIYKNTFFGQEQSSQGFIIISAALESQVGFNYFCVNIGKPVFAKKHRFCLLGNILRPRS